ncbi:MAG: glycosyltransferase family A protein [Patulibacter sp.]|nr:glycosyltransferase family A protein [Patulibacter sp.]
MSAPTWTILVPTIPERAETFGRLMYWLLPQLEEHGGRVTVLARRNVGAIPLGELRDLMLHAAPGEYVSFIDDDDMVPDYYVVEVLRALEDRPDHVGFQLNYFEDGRLSEVVDHSLRHGRWHRNLEGQLVRDLTHIDPVRRDLALRGQFGAARRGRAEDRAWVKQVRPLLKTEAYIDKIMYHYLWSEAGSSWARNRVIAPASVPLPELRSPYARWDPASV